MSAHEEDPFVAEFLDFVGDLPDEMPEPWQDFDYGLVEGHDEPQPTTITTAAAIPAAAAIAPAPAPAFEEYDFDQWVVEHPDETPAPPSRSTQPEEKVAAHRPKGSKKVVLRRPQSGDAYYSLSKEVKDDSMWADNAALSKSERQRVVMLSHVGRIEETTAGVLRRPACSRCVEKGHACKTYSPEAKAEYAGKASKNDVVCARCLYASKQKSCE